MLDNIILSTDSYKQSHALFYPSKTTKIHSYLESRGGEFENTIFFGLQYLLKSLEGKVVTKENVDEAEYVLNHHLGNCVFDRKLWDYIVDHHNGHLPVRIKAAKEGSVIPTKNVLLTIENTDPNCYWLTNFLETYLVQLWYPCTVATQSRAIKDVILKELEDTGTPEDVDFKLVDFGVRGSTSIESSAIGGASHLINFKATDNLPAIQFIRRHYHKDLPDAFSIPATEHSTITAWGKENELEAYRNVLQQYPTGMVACVSDSYDIENACKNLWGKELKAEVLGRNGILVVRPDSSYPPDIVCDCLKWLSDSFGWSLNSKGYKTLHPKVRVIQGDGIDLQMISSIYTTMRFKGWSADNVAFGSGGGLLQKLNRDTCRWAMKCSTATINGEEVDVYKEPKSDMGKSSKKGELILRKENGKYITERKTSQNETQNLLDTVFLNGKILRQQSFDDIVAQSKR